MRKLVVGAGAIAAIGVGAIVFTQRGGEGLDNDRVLVLPERTVTVGEARTMIRTVILTEGTHEACDAYRKYSDREVFDILARLQADDPGETGWATPTSDDDVAVIGRIFKAECRRLFP